MCIFVPVLYILLDLSYIPNNLGKTIWYHRWSNMVNNTLFPRYVKEKMSLDSGVVLVTSMAAYLPSPCNDACLHLITFLTFYATNKSTQILESFLPSFVHSFQRIFHQQPRPTQQKKLGNILVQRDRQTTTHCRYFMYIVRVKGRSSRKKYRGYEICMLCSASTRVNE